MTTTNVPAHWTIVSYPTLNEGLKPPGRANVCRENSLKSLASKVMNDWETLLRMGNERPPSCRRCLPREGCIACSQCGLTVRRVKTMKSEKLWRAFDSSKPRWFQVSFPPRGPQRTELGTLWA